MSAAATSASSLVPSRPGGTDGQTRGTVTSGVFPNRSNSSAPDLEQKKREQSRDETRKALGLRTTHPTYTRNQYDTNPGIVGDSNRDRATAVADGTA